MIARFNQNQDSQMTSIAFPACLHSSSNWKFLYFESVRPFIIYPPIWIYTYALDFRSTNSPGHIVNRIWGSEMQQMWKGYLAHIFSLYFLQDVWGSMLDNALSHPHNSRDIDGYWKIGRAKVMKWLFIRGEVESDFFLLLIQDSSLVLPNLVLFRSVGLHWHLQGWHGVSISGGSVWQRMS